MVSKQGKDFFVPCICNLRHLLPIPVNRNPLGSAALLIQGDVSLMRQYLYLCFLFVFAFVFVFVFVFVFADTEFVFICYPSVSSANVSE